MPFFKWFGVSFGCLVLVASASAQTVFEFKYFGSSYTTNKFGTIQNLVTHHTLLRQEAKRLGVTDIKNLVLAYRIGGSHFGDTVDLMRRDTGEVLSTLFGFFFGSDTSLLRQSIMNLSGTEEKRLDYVYTRQNSHSLGAALVTKSGSQVSVGGEDFKVRGEMHYIVAPEAGKPVQICRGRFLARKPLQFGS